MRDLWNSVLAKTRQGENCSEELKKITQNVLEGKKVATIQFGTSGWRSVIGEEYTLGNIARVTRAIHKMYQLYAEELSPYTGVLSYSQFKKEGVLIGHDSRYMGKEMASVVGHIFLEAGIRVGYAGTSTTPELSAALVEGDFACSINLTSSHNPGLYGGYKFNPKDGGPASIEITSCIEKLAVAEPLVLSALPTSDLPRFDSLKAYSHFLGKSTLLNIPKIKEWAHSGKLALAVDHVGGATSSRIQYLLDHPQSLKAFRDTYDPLFGGIAPEPSETNMETLMSYINSLPNELKLGAIMDPDGDRVRFYDGEADISMNQFGAIAFHFLAVHKGCQGGVGKSVATSNLVNAIAKGLGRPMWETAVGFKNFRPHLLPSSQEPALVCFEESDGISGWGNTLEKDAHFGYLLAIEIMMTTGKTLKNYLDNLYREFGVFFPLRFGFDVSPDLMGEGVKKIMSTLVSKFYPGDVLNTAQGEKKIVEVLTLDGLKMVFEDGSWLLIRPSGTEPKVRVYAEAQNAPAAEALFELAKDLFLGAQK